MDPEKRKEWTSYQDWLFAIQDVFTKNTLAYDTRFVTDEDLTPDQLEPLEKEKDSRQISSRMSVSQRIFVRALDILENVDQLNQLYAPAIHLPIVRYTKSDQRNSTSRSWMPMASRSWMRRL